MPKINKQTLLTTRLATSDLGRFKKVAQEKSCSHSQLVREAILQYLDSHEQEQRHVIESIYAKQLDTSTNRICSLLARVACETHAMYQWLAEAGGDTGKELMAHCTAVAAKRISTSLDPQTKLIADTMTAVIKE